MFSDGLEKRYKQTIDEIEKDRRLPVIGSSASNFISDLDADLVTGVDVVLNEASAALVNLLSMGKKFDWDLSTGSLFSTD